MTDSEQGQLLEIYRLHAQLADRVSQRREGANRLYVTLLVGLLALVATLIRFGPSSVDDESVLVIVGIVGFLLAISWWTVIRSYKQLNSEKFRVLHELEKKLPFQFFTLEWDPQATGGKSNSYWRLTHVESLLPSLFGLFFLGVFAYGLYRIC